GGGVARVCRARGRAAAGPAGEPSGSARSVEGGGVGASSRASLSSLSCHLEPLGEGCSSSREGALAFRALLSFRASPKDESRNRGGHSERASASRGIAIRPKEGPLPG